MKQLLTAFVIWGFASGAYAKDVVLTWEPVTERADGSAVAALDGYNLYHYVNNTIQDPIAIAPSAVDYTLLDVEDGLYVFQIAAVEGGKEGPKTDPLVLPVGIAIVKAVDGFSGEVRQ